MHFGRFPRKTLLAATLLFAFSSANASFVEQVGTPSTPLAVMGAYAADAAIKPGLKAVIPPGWQLFHHQSVELPASLSWEKDDTWVTVLNKFASKNDIAVLIDWEKKQVFFRSTAMALQEQEKRQMITQAASTPLPAFKGPEQKPAAGAIAKPAENIVEKIADKSAAVAAVAAPAPGVSPPGAVAVRTPVIAAVPAAAPAPSVAVVPQAVAPAPVAVAPAPAVAGSLSASVVAAPSVDQVPARALTVSPAPVVAAAPTPAKHTVRPPVKAAPVLGAAAIEVKPTVAVLPVTAPAVARTLAPIGVAVVPTAIAPAPVRAAVIATPASVQAPVVTSALAPAPAPAPVILPPAPVAAASVVPVAALVAAPGAVAFNREPVSAVIAAAGAKHGYTVSWDASQVVFQGPVTLLGADMGEDMNLVLRALGGRRAPVEITVYRSSNVVVVRDALTGNAAVSFTEVPFSGRIREITAPKSNSGLFAAQVAAPAPVRATAAPVVPPAPVLAPAPAPKQVAPTPLPAPMRPVPVYVAPAVTVAAAEAVRVTPEPARLDTAVATVKKLEPAQPLVESTARVVTLRVAAGNQLRDAIEAILEPGWSLKWDVKDELQANTELMASGESLKAVLNQVLPRLKLSFDIYKPSKLVVVREADPALDK